MMLPVKGLHEACCVGASHSLFLGIFKGLCYIFYITSQYIYNIYKQVTNVSPSTIMIAIVVLECIIYS